MATERTLTVGDLDVALLEAGAGGRPLMLVHGFTGAKEDFQEYVGHVDALGDLGWHVVAPDTRGHGSTAKPAGEHHYDLDSYAADVHGLADTLGWDRFALLGHSMGGMIVQVAALARPERIGALVLMDTCHGPLEGLDPDLMAAGVSLVRAQGIAKLVEIYAADRDGGLLATDAARRQRSRPGYDEWCDRKLSACSADMWVAMNQAMQRAVDRLAELPSLADHDVPVLVMIGEQDVPFIRPSERMADAIPGAELVWFADAGHSPQLEAADAWRDALVGFLTANWPADERAGATS